MAVFLIDVGKDKPAGAVVQVIFDAHEIDECFRDALTDLRSADQAGGMIRLDAGETSLAETNERLRDQIGAAWVNALCDRAARAEDVVWVEVFDAGPRGERRKLQLALDAGGAAIDAAKTTRG